ncbi:MAG: hypothetical protein NT018_14110 [Armatimonadetes bacterium]|nr:hypothetical protein [Armatimonadota bacterium]
MPTYGIEEEVFVTEPERPTLESFYYLARLLAKDPAYYYTHSAHNFARGKDLKQGWVGGVEISTGVHDDIEALVDDLAVRRAELASVCTGLIVPMGHLINYNAPTNTCALHIHIGGMEDNRRLYGNLIHFLPILGLFTANSPMVDGEYFGQSYRMSQSWAIGPIQDDWKGRFQDVILSKRLGTVELRVLDPCWDLGRVRWLMRAVKAIAELDIELDPGIETYNTLRAEICKTGLLDKTMGLAEELRALVGFPMEMLERTASDELQEMYNKDGLLGAYSALDNGYRNGIFEPRPVNKEQKADIAKGIVGFAAYFIPRLPYYAWKGFREL